MAMNIIKILALGAFTCVGMMASRSADARSIGGYDGNIVSGMSVSGSTVNSCLKEQWGNVINNCASTTSASIEYGLPVDAPGYYNPTIAAHGGLNGVVGCGSVSGSQIGFAGGGYYQWSGTKNAPQGDVTFQPGQVYVPSGGFLFVGCSLPGTTLVYGVDW
jgi:hypothetical protein